MAVRVTILPTSLGLGATLLPWLILAVLSMTQAFAVGVLLVPLVRKAASRMGLLDRPGIPRKLHDTPIPRSGGIAIFAAFWGCLALNLLAARYLVPQLTFLPEQMITLAGNVDQRLQQLAMLFVGSAMIFAIGLLDDRYDLPPITRLVVQVVATLPLLASGVVLKLFLPPLLAWPITIMWLVFLTNSFNFLDNMNGLTSGVSAIICLIMGLMAALSREWYMLLIFSLLAGAIIAFWLFNFPKASIFLGDCGSTHLGFLIGGLAIITTYYQEGVPTKLPILIPMVVLGIPLFDTISVMWIRWRTGKPFMQGDTNHLSHRLVALGMTRTEAVRFIYGCTVVLGLAALPLRIMEWRYGLLQAVVIGLIFFLLHWLERVSYRRLNAEASNPPSQ